MLLFAVLGARPALVPARLATAINSANALRCDQEKILCSPDEPPSPRSPALRAHPASPKALRTNQELYLREFHSSDDGVIGPAIFADFIVEADFLRPAVRLYPPASFRYEDHGAVFPIDLWSYNPHVQVLLTIDAHDPVKARMTADSGARALPMRS